MKIYSRLTGRPVFALADQHRNAITKPTMTTPRTRSSATGANRGRSATARARRSTSRARRRRRRRDRDVRQVNACALGEEKTASRESHRVGVAVLLEQFAEPDIVQVVHPALELGQFLGDRRERLHVLPDRLQQGQRRRTTSLESSMRYVPISRIGGSTPAPRTAARPWRCCLHLIDGIVHRGDQVLDVSPVERRDEGAANGGRTRRVISRLGVRSG